MGIVINHQKWLKQTIWSVTTKAALTIQVLKIRWLSTHCFDHFCDAVAAATTTIVLAATTAMGALPMALATPIAWPSVGHLRHSFCSNNSNSNTKFAGCQPFEWLTCNTSNSSSSSSRSSNIAATMHNSVPQTAENTNWCQSNKMLPYCNCHSKGNFSLPKLAINQRLQARKAAN